MPSDSVGKTKSPDQNGLAPGKAASDTLVRHYSEHFSRRADRTSTLLLAWIASLVVIFVSALLPLSEKLNQLDRLDARGEQVRLRLRANTEQRTLAASQKDISNTKSLDRDREVLLTRRIRTTAERVRLRRELTNVSTPLGAIPLPAFYVPVLWLCLLSGLLVFFSYRRLVLLNLAQRVLSLPTSHDWESVLVDRAIGAPFWLAPLPTTFAEPDTALRDGLGVFYGWRSAGKWAGYVTLGIGVIGFALSLWAVSLAFAITAYHPDPHLTFRIRLAAVGLFAIGWLTSLLLFAFPTTAASGSWVPQNPARRRFVTAAGGAMMSAAALFVVLPRSYLPRWLTFDAPRRRVLTDQRPAPDQFRNKFLLNRTSGVVHFISASGWHSERASLVSKGIAEVAMADVIALLKNETEAGQRLETHLQVPPKVDRAQVRIRLNRNQLAAITECLAAQKLAHKRITEAVEILWVGLVKDDELRLSASTRPNYRLYDLLARGLMQTRDSEGVQRLRNHADRTWPGDAELKARAARWHADTVPSKNRPAWKHTYERSRGYLGLGVESANGVIVG